MNPRDTGVLLRGRESRDGVPLTPRDAVRDSIGFLGGGGNNEGGCFEGLRGLMDPNLKDYPLAEALCLVVLAKACVEDDPLHRLSMDDIMKVLAKMLLVLENKEKNELAEFHVVRFRKSEHFLTSCPRLFKKVEICFNNIS
ncbi:lysM domain receptor-like kinase 4 [Senna tora]|uniref:LysM domain receptor-like kinase 4 n=1 Tax=Senna tora TaxID=362788 RepID=A0A834SFC8_9FABA|nr:lysM domain receptor-like kinase 4 [Senna tora]